MCGILAADVIRHVPLVVVFGWCFNTLCNHYRENRGFGVKAGAVRSLESGGSKGRCPTDY